MVAVLCSAGITVALVQSMIFPMIPRLPALLNTSPMGASWVVTSTLMAATVVTPIAGRLGDLFGKRRLLLVSLALIVAGSLVCAASSTLVLVVVGRVLQGLALGAIPLGLSIMRDELATARIPGGVAAMSATVGIGGALGMPIAAAVLAAGPWQVLFLFTAVVGSLCLAAVALVVPPSPTTASGRFDIPGAVGLALVLVGLLLVVTRGAEWGYTSPTVAVLALAVLAGALCWIWWQRRSHSPLVDVRVAARPALAWTNLTALLLGFTMYTQGLAFPQMMNAPIETGYGHGISMVEAGVLMAPGGVTMMLLSPLTARLTLARGPRATLVAAGVFVAAGYLLPLIWYQEPWHLMIASIVMCIGLAFGYGAMPMLIMAAVPVGETAAANGVNALVRSLGLAVSGAVVTAILASSTVTLQTTTYPTLDTFRIAYGLTAVVALLAIASALRVPVGRHAWGRTT